MYKLFVYILFLIFINFTTSLYAQDIIDEIEKNNTYNFEKLETYLTDKQSVDQVAEIKLFTQRKELAKYILDNNEINNIPDRITKNMVIAQIMFFLDDTRKTIDTFYKDSKTVVSVNVSFLLNKDEVAKYLNLANLRNDMYINLRNLSEIYSTIESELKKSTPKTYREVIDKLELEEKIYRDSYNTISNELSSTLKNFDNNEEEKRKIINKRMECINSSVPAILKDPNTENIVKSLLEKVPAKSLENRDLRLKEIKQELCESTMKNILDTDNPVEKSILESETYRVDYIKYKQEIKKLNDDLFNEIKSLYNDKNNEIKNSSLSKEEIADQLKKNKEEYNKLLKYKQFIYYYSYANYLSCLHDVFIMYQNHDYIYGDFKEDIRVTVLKPDYDKKIIKIIFGLFGKKYEETFSFLGYEDIIGEVYKNKDFIKAIPVFSITDKGKKSRKEIKGFNVLYTGKYTKDGDYVTVQNVQIRDVTPFPELEDYNKVIKYLDDTVKKYLKQ